MKHFDAIIIGAGASGMMCTATALKRGKKVAVIEHNSKPLQKVFISGGGKCNFTNLSASQEHYFSSNPNFCISALKQFSPQDMLNFVHNHKIQTYQKTPGQFFCQKSSVFLINVLLSETSSATFFYNTVFKDFIITPKGFIVSTNKEKISCNSLVISSGGLSYTNLGASSIGYNIAEKYGHSIVPCSPALVPLNLDSSIMKDLIKLQGISLPVEITINKHIIKDDLLFTHFGLSGPAILQASIYWKKGIPLNINFLPHQNVFSLLKSLKNHSKQKINTVFKAYFPQKFINNFLTESSSFYLAETPDKKLLEISSKINNWTITPISARGYKSAEVTKGGIDTKNISSQTMESKLIKNLYFTGEVLDITGDLGGFNLQWAFSSGYVAGKNL